MRAVAAADPLGYPGRPRRGDLDGAMAMTGEIRSPQAEAEALKLTLGVLAERKPAR